MGLVFLFVDLFKRLSRVISWLPTIWQDMDWDESFVLKILDKKLAYMEKHFIACLNYIKTDDEVKQIHTCRLLIQRLIDNDYNSGLDIEHLYDDFDEFISKSNAGEKTIICHTFPYKGNRWMSYESYMASQDVSYLCTLLRKYLRTWWI